MIRPLPAARAFWVVAAAFAVLMAFATLPTPLYPLYQAHDHIESWVITVVFAAYGVGVVGGLYLAGHVSDWFGRRPVVVAAGVSQLVSAAVFAAFPQVPGLVVGRLVCGLGVGALAPAATAYVTELRALARPGENPVFASTVATAVNMGGLAAGSLVGGLLTQWWPDPLRLPYVVYLGVMLVATLAVLFAPETVTRPERLPAYRPQRVYVDEGTRGLFVVAGVAAATAFSLLGVVTSMTASFLATTLGEPSRLLAGAVVCAVTAGSMASQIVFGPLPLRRRLRLGRTLLFVGALGVAGAALLASLWLYVAAGIVAGLGIGLVFQAAIGTAGRLAHPDHRGGTIAGMFLAAYTGLTVPVVLVGVAVTLVGEPVPVLVGFALLVLVLVVAATTRVIATTPER